MTSKEIGKADIAVPKNLTIRKPERSATLTSHGTRGLWKSKQLDSITNEFDAVFPGNAETSSQLLEKNPGLLAIRNKTAKSKSRSTKTKPYTIRPITAAEQPQLIPTLFNRPTTTFQHTRHQSSVQYVQKNIEAERAALSFSEDPVAYFAKRKDGSGHKFIYLNYAGDRNNPNFNPYELKKVPYAEIDEEYFTMSASGVTRIQPDGNTEQVSIDTWAKESSIFMSIRKLKTFSQYYYWRPFRFWKKFVMNQRYSQLNQFLNVHPYWSNKRFFSSIISILSTTSDSMIKKYLLPFIPQKKYTLTSFHQIVEENKKLLYKEFSEFLQNIAKIICDLYISIKDPTRIKVEDKDFQEIKRRNPNIGQLIVLEQKIAAEKDRRVKLVQNEISSLSYFIRMIDYMILESMAKSCSECWELAAENASQEQSSIFQIEMSFSDDGKVSFDIPLEEVIGNVRKCLHDSFITLNELPRLTNMVQLREYLKENIVDGPTFESIKAPDTSYSKNEDIILNIISASYKSAEASCQAYKDYYSIFKLGVNWNEERYIHKRGGEEKEYNLSQLIGDNDLPTPLIFNYAKEPTVDFNVIRVDIEKFKADINKMSQFHTCTSKGILFIDGRKLKSFLEPIPTKSLELIHNTLIDLLKRKMEYLLNLFSYCAKKLKKEPASLEQYVEFCEFTAAIEEITPLIAMEITFTDELRTLLEESNLHTVLGIQNPQELVSTRNPLHDAFKTFKSDKLIARNLKELDADKFTIVLQQRLRIREQKLNKYNSTIMSYPLNVANARVDVLLPEMKQIKEKIIQIEPEIDALIHCQKVMGVKQPDLSIYKDMKAGSLFTVDLYQTIVQFNDIQDQMENIPFSTINIEKFSNDVKTLDQDIFNLRNAGRPVNSLLTDLYQKFDQILSFIDQLKQLASGNLRLRHWNKLFDECGQPNQYTPQITISEMAKMGILAQKEKIHVITSNSQGECELETNFSNIKMKWMEVQLPLLDSQVKSEDSLLLGNVNLLFQEITDTQLTLQQMLQVPFVQSIAKDIKELSLVLENYAQVVDAWSTFQANWVILSTFFSQEETKTILEAQSHKFQMVRRRWMALIRHTLENTTLFHVCSFPSLLDMLIENNRTLETILVASVKYIDKKREIMPRLYFLSNDEVLTLLSTTNFDLFNKHLIKLFMHIKNFDYHITEAEQNQQKKKLPSKTTEVKKLNKFLNCQDFSKLKIYGMVSQSFDSIVFDKKLRCAGPVEKWVNDLISIMKNYIKDEIGKSLKTCSSVPLNDWVMGAPTYIAILTLYINFTSDIEECFVNFENNPRAFANYENTISQKIDDLINALSSPLSPHELQKISSIITLFNAQISIVRSLSEKIPLYSQRMNWGNRIKMRFNPDKKILTVEFGETVIEHGYEYWGHGVQYIYTPSTEKVLLNLCSSISNGGKVYDTPYIYGSAMCGKKHLISDLASLYGQFIYFIPTFKEKNFYIYERLLIGAAKTGFWLAFHNIQLNSQPNLCFLYESI
ncbi:hypothetical protein TRFO_39049 [Tritrichomonas foetus]|uniref:Dynein heavy chain family protein n=1 Tax=Tritrichomonas foetus TaxID=1144522 RepID=A0A1J4J7Y1_9EUKA|nr:hypothetical protein TRFO_39049 [Tritrichomonas foetus]|eukprot:OHS94777.1 hypothetical protein TRFO_39049 [Tritrichomonas foetus]